MAALGITLPPALADTANLNLKLTIITPPVCTLKGNNVMSVDFGDVEQGLIDGVYKKKLIDYGLTCSSVASNALKMTLSWEEVSPDGKSAIKSGLSNLGVAIYRDGTRLGNNASLNFTNGSPPTLYAVPVKPSGMTLTNGGSFSGWMTLTLAYQ
jgi:type 1 fimbria pilin